MEPNIAAALEKRIYYRNHFEMGFWHTPQNKDMKPKMLHGGGAFSDRTGGKLPILWRIDVYTDFP